MFLHGPQLGRETLQKNFKLGTQSLSIVTSLKILNNIIFMATAVIYIRDKKIYFLNNIRGGFGTNFNR